MNQYHTLFRPLELRGLTLKNRLLSSPTSTAGFDAAGHYSDEMISYYRLKALGGTALVTVGEGQVELKTGQSKPTQIDLSDPTAEISLVNMINAIHAGGAAASIQLDHGGALALPKLMGHPAMGPCTYTNHRGDPVVAMTDDDLYRIAEVYGKAAARAKKCGFDMVMLHGGHGWLLHQFISEITNHRTDKWGGPLTDNIVTVAKILLFYDGNQQKNALGFYIMTKIVSKFLPGNAYLGGVVCDFGSDIVEISYTHP